MSWKDARQLALVLLGINLVGAGLGTRWEWVALGVFVLGVAVWNWASIRSWRKRLEHLRNAEQSAQEEELASLSAEERIAARLALGQVVSDDARVDAADGETFSYSVTPRSLRLAVLGGSLFMAGLPTVLLLSDRVAPDQEVWAMLVGLGFSLGVLLSFRSWANEDTKIRVTSSGLQEIRPEGRRVGILWSEVVWVRNRPWLSAVEVYAVDGRRRIRIWYTLERFARLMELLTAHLKWAEERFGGSGGGVSDSSGSIGA